MSSLCSSATDIQVGPYFASEPYMDNEDKIELFPFTKLNAVAWRRIEVVELKMYRLLTPALEDLNFKSLWTNKQNIASVFAWRSESNVFLLSRIVIYS
jgi:hypothetical protein